MEAHGVLSGVRVAELSIAFAAPFCGKILALHGADVIRVESRVYPDTLRLIGTSWSQGAEYEGVRYETNPYIAEFHVNKRSVGLELKVHQGLEAFNRLVANCDVFITNFSASAIQRLGLTADRLRRINSRLVCVSLSAFGSDPTLPYYDYAAWGPNQSPLAGLDDRTGEDGREPAGILQVAIPDAFGGLQAVMAVLAGLDRRDTTGEGCFIDVSQFDTTASLTGTSVMEHQLTGSTIPRTGNKDPRFSPSGVYPCLGEDSWVAISVLDDGAWAALSELPGMPLTLREVRYREVDERKADSDLIDEYIRTWTAARGAEEAAALLQAAGIAAYRVADARAILQDPHVRDRTWFGVHPSGRFERDLCGGHAIRFERKPVRVRRGSPLSGEHTAEVLEEVAGLSPADVDELVAQGAATTATEPERRLRRPYDPYLYALGITDDS